MPAAADTFSIRYQSRNEFTEIRNALRKRDGHHGATTAGERKWRRDSSRQSSRDFGAGCRCCQHQMICAYSDRQVDGDSMIRTQITAKAPGGAVTMGASPAMPAPKLATAIQPPPAAIRMRATE